jgi:hypothetical protein
MLFKRVSRTSPEVIYMVAQNVSGGTLTAGYSAVFDTGASVDGVRVTQATTAALNSFAGVADSDIANNAYGLLQVYGYRASAYIYSSTGSSVAGDILGTVNAEWGLTPSASAGVAKAFGFLCEALAASSSSRFHLTCKTFIRGL